MIARLTAFAGELRDVGIPVSLVEMIDAAEALEHADLGSLDALRAALGATMVKRSRHRPAFDAAFEVFFGPSSTAASEPGELDEETVRARIADALVNGDIDELRRLLRDAVDRYAGVDPARPVGGRYHQYRVLRRLDADQLRRRCWQP